MAWGATMAAALKAAETVDEVESWLSENAAPLGNCLNDAPKIRARLDAIVDDRMTALPRAAAALEAQDGDEDPGAAEPDEQPADGETAENVTEAEAEAE